MTRYGEGTLLVWDAYEMMLNECQTGDEADIVAVEAETNVAARLRELGLVPGTRVRVSRSGSPMILEIGASRVCLRADELVGVHVQVAVPAPSRVNVAHQARELA